MALTAAGQRALLISIGEAAGPVTLDALRAQHPDLAADAVSRGAVRLAMMGLVRLGREGGTLTVTLSQTAADLLGCPATCRRCGLPAAFPDPRCWDGRDHYAGKEHGCPCCGRLVKACNAHPCTAMR
jgi:hypothetical protein